jgi:hypothetical protein
LAPGTRNKSLRERVDRACEDIAEVLENRHGRS